MDKISKFFGGSKRVSEKSSNEDAKRLESNKREKRMKESDSPKIFKLDIDCFDEIFEYLSLEDLHSFGQTCKTMQQVTGQYFKRNYVGAEKFTNEDGIYTVCSGIEHRTKISGFNQFINYTSHYHNELGPLQYIQGHGAEFASINEIYLVCCEINEATVKSVEKILPKIEVVRVRQCTIVGDYYDKFLKFCGNLKFIYVQDDVGDIVKERKNPWLQREYPSLETFQLTARNSFKVNDLNSFFERNPSIRTFLTTSGVLWRHCPELLRSNAKLDTLEIYDGHQVLSITMQTFCNLLNQLHERGFYKRLRLNVTGPNQECGEQFASLQALESISIMHFSERCGLSRLINLKELTIYDGFNPFDMEILAKNLVNLTRISLNKAKLDDILPFIQLSGKLNKIHASFTENILDLQRLNEERMKLVGGRKVVIYVPDDVFLATKWCTKNGDTNLKYIEMKRSTSA
ncbi:uncharacterized protein LOC129570762 [Sitodiplosis mosellana]|uniref:uncharacterized protein LOC129570762 n=1 Tax=Sitodiplosis mosellana TaxID=263140 RepID=UPI0024447756|nr:uncharacterized protein LOC129570762 [Sitodiplosis mosellana]